MSSTRAKRLREIYRRLYKFYGPQGWWPGKTRLEVIVGAILTQNTSWKNVERAIANLRKRGFLKSAAKINGADNRKLARLIKPSGYYNIKSKRLKNFTAFLCSGYDGNLNNLGRLDSAKLRAELLSVNGVGPETCDSILLYAFNRPVFVIDAYTKRVLARHGIASADSTYDEAQRLFTDNLSADSRLFNEYHALIVRLCKEFCRTKPRCESCPLSGL